MPVVPRLLVGSALITTLGLVGAPTAWAGAVPCDAYSQGCETPPPTGGVDVPGEGGGLPSAPPTTPATTPPGGTDGDTDGPGTGGTDADGDTDGPGGGGTSGAGTDGGTDGTGGAVGDTSGGDVGAEGGALPFTGGEVALAAVTGLGAVAVGTVLLVAARRRTSPA